MGPRLIRFVTHLNVTDRDVDCIETAVRAYKPS